MSQTTHINIKRRVFPLIKTFRTGPTWVVPSAFALLQLNVILVEYEEMSIYFAPTLSLSLHAFGYKVPNINCSVCKLKRLIHENNMFFFFVVVVVVFVLLLLFLLVSSHLPWECPSADSRRAVVSFWRKNLHDTGQPLRGLSLPSKLTALDMTPLGCLGVKPLHTQKPWEWKSLSTELWSIWRIPYST